MQRGNIFCDKEPSESNAKIHELEIGEQVAALQKDLAALATSRGVRGVVRGSWTFIRWVNLGQMFSSGLELLIVLR